MLDVFTGEPFGIEGFVQLYQSRVTALPGSPVNTVPPALSLASNTYTITPGTWTGNPTIVVSHRVIINGVENPTDLVGLTFPLDVANAGKTIVVKEVAVNGIATASALTNAVVQPATLPIIVTAPILSYANGVYTVTAAVWNQPVTVTRAKHINGVYDQDLVGLSWSKSLDDDDSSITVVETATTAAGNTTSTSNAIFQYEVPVNTLAPVLSQSGNTFTIVSGTYTGSATITITRNKVVDGVVGASIPGLTFTASSADNGKTISVREVATNAGGNVAAPSNAVVQTEAPVNTTAPILAGPTNGNWIITPGVWRGYPAPTVTLNAVTDGVVGSVLVGTVFPVNSASAGKNIQVRERAVNVIGGVTATVDVFSNTIVQPASSADAPVNTVAGTLTRNAVTGVFTHAHGTWTGNPAPTLKDFPQINGVTQAEITTPTFTLPNLVTGDVVRVREEATNVNGFSAAATASITVTSLAIPFDTIASYGSLVIGGEHTGVKGNWGSTTEYQYQWTLNGVVVSAVATCFPGSAGTLIFRVRGRGTAGVWSVWYEAPPLTISNSTVVFTVGPTATAKQLDTVRSVAPGTLTIVSLPDPFDVIRTVAPASLTLGGIPS
jgi:hypothetical protein